MCWHYGRCHQDCWSDLLLAIRVLFSKCVCEVTNGYRAWLHMGRYVHMCFKRRVYTPLSVLHSKATRDTCLVKNLDFGFLH